MFTTQEELIQELKELGCLRSSQLETALKRVDRKDFIPEEFKNSAYANEPIPIGFNQTTSQPYTIVFMLELAEIRPGDAVLEIGSGSGWQTALIAELVGPKGRVISIERIKELHHFASENLEKYHYPQVTLLIGDGSKGYPSGSPYDTIIAGAAAKRIPGAWRDQVSTGGRIVFPMGSSVYRLQKHHDGTFSEKEYFGFAFVPLVED